MTRTFKFQRLLRHAIQFFHNFKTIENLNFIRDLELESREFQDTKIKIRKFQVTLIDFQGTYLKVKLDMGHAPEKKAEVLIIVHLNA